MNVQDYLSRKGIVFQVIKHEQAFTAQEVAAKEHVTGHHFAKTVIAGDGGKAFMFVLPASRHVDMHRASDLIGSEVSMVSEQRMKQLFPDCEIGAEPPFGEEYGLPTYVDETLEGSDEIVFRAGTHDTTIKMSYSDYKGLEHPHIARFAAPMH
jgi:Ala-tRNA(Pro) deacylase